MTAPQEVNLTVQSVRDLGGGLARELARARDHSYVCAFDRDFTLALALGLSHALALARDLSHARDLFHARDLSHNLFRDLALALARNLARAQGRTCTYDLAHDLVDVIQRAHTSVRLLADLLDQAVAQAAAMASVSGTQQQRYPSRVARHVTGWSVRVLPAVDQARYQEECEAELFELRERSRWVQLWYAVQLLVHSVWLRRALRQPAPVVPARKRGW
jgi:hypothetical protein